MKRIHPEDPRVTAHALGELPKHEAAEIDRAGMSNPAVQDAMDETRELAELIRKAYAVEALELGEERREAIRQAGRCPTPENILSMQPRRRWVRSLGVSAAAAALVMAGVWTLWQIREGDEVPVAVDSYDQQIGDLRFGILTTPAPRPGPRGQGQPPLEKPSSLFEVGSPLTPEEVEREYNKLRDLSEQDPNGFLERVRSVARTATMRTLARLPALVDNPFISSREEMHSEVPIAAGSASFALAERFVRNEQRLPPPNGVRVEELINHVVYEDEGDAELDGIKLGVELMRCPWDEEAILMGVLVRNESDEIVSGAAVIQVEVKAEHIRSYRLLGYADPEGADTNPASLTHGLAPGKSNYVLYQLVPANAEVFEKTRVVARVALHPNEDGVLLVPVNSPPRDWFNATNDAQAAVALGAYGMLLRNSGYKGTLDAAMLADLTDDAMESAPPGDLARRHALQLIVDTLPLLGIEREQP